jgi:hypothetical protein
MWALVEDNKIKQVFMRPKAITLNGIQHSEHLFTHSTEEELRAKGIYPVVKEGSKENDKFYKNSETFTFDVDTQTAKHVTTATIKTDIDGKKEKMVSQINTIAKSLLEPTDWFIIRELETKSKKLVPYYVLQYRSAVREAANSNETNISNAVTMEELMVVSAEWPDIDDYPVDMVEPTPEPK